MLISKLGERGLIERLRRRIRTDSSVCVGSGDDCAVLRFDRKSYQLFTCDMLVEGVDFTRRDSPYLVGRKAIAVQVSDIASCGGIPKHCVVAVGAPLRTTVRVLDSLLEGMLEITKRYKINLVGGDFSRAPRLVIDVAMLGVVEKKKLVLRNGAGVGDIILVTGSLGGSIKGKHLKFTPRVKEARSLVESFKISAMIDISDGLTADLSQILKASKVGAKIYEQRIPLSREASGTGDALFSGEDFELLFTAPRSQAGRILKKFPGKIRAIGEVVGRKYGLRLIGKDLSEKRISPQGFDHFR